MTDIDETFSAADQERLRKLEQMMEDRGYVRDRHGFWTAPAVGQLPAVKQREQQ